MVALFTALGLKHALDESRFDALTHGLFDGAPDPKEVFIRDGSCELQIERRRNMGPFSLVLRLPNLRKNPMDSLLPMVREPFARRITRVSMEEPRPGFFVMNGLDTKTNEHIEFIPTAVSPIFKQDPAVPEKQGRLDGPYSCYGLSADASIILGNETNTEAEAKAWQRAQNNEERDALFKKRLETEDAYSVVDGFFVQTEEPATYRFLGVITHIDKLMNPNTEEWVYRLFVRLNAEGYAIYIHPEMLQGEPKLGRRFKGTVTFFGMPNPKTLLEDRDNGFY